MKTSGIAKTVAMLAILSFILNNLASGAQAAQTMTEGNDPAEVMFDPSRVDNISLKMSWTDYNSLSTPNVNWDSEGDWRSAKMTATIAGKKYGPLKVGVHLKGAWGSWRDINGKAGFKIKLDAFVQDQTLLGIKKLTLNNMVQDSSYIHEVMTYKVMRSFGVPAPRTGYTGITVNGVDYGLHLNVETVNDHMLKRWGLTSKHLYKGAVPYFPDFYQNTGWQFGIETGDTVDTSDLDKFLDVNALRGEQWWEEIQKIADMDEMTKNWAVELFTGHWDGYVVNKNNYYVNFDNDGIATLIPWGTDQTWGGSADYFTYKALLPNKCKGSVGCTELYLQNLAKLSHLASGLNLYQYASKVKAAISKAIEKDRFGDGLIEAESQQNSAIARFSEESAILAALVAPWDTTISGLLINNSVYKPTNSFYLAPEFDSATISAIPVQRDAKSSSTTKTLLPGNNQVTFDVISPDGQHTNSKTFEIYVLSQRQSSIPLLLKNASNFTTQTQSSLTALIAKLDSARNIELTFEIPKTANKSFAENKIQLFLKSLKTADIFTRKVSRVYVSGSSQIKVNISYQN